MSFPLRPPESRAWRQRTKYIVLIQNVSLIRMSTTQKTFHFQLVWRSIYRSRRAHPYQCDGQDADRPQGVKPHAGLIRPLFDMQVNVRKACGASLKNVARI